MNFKSKFVRLVSACSVAFVALAGPAEAAISVGANVITDTTSGLSWYRDLSAFANETYQQQVQAIAGLNASDFGGISTWRVATFTDHITIRPFLYADPTIFFPSVSVVGEPTWYGGRYDSTVITDPWNGQFNAYKFTPNDPSWPSGYETVYNIGTGVADPATGIWIVAGSVTAPIPEPETYAMMLAGLGLLAFMSRRRKQKEAVAA